MTVPHGAPAAGVHGRLWRALLASRDPPVMLLAFAAGCMDALSYLG